MIKAAFLSQLREGEARSVIESAIHASGTNDTQAVLDALLSHGDLFPRLMDGIVSRPVVLGSHTEQRGDDSVAAAAGQPRSHPQASAAHASSLDSGPPCVVLEVLGARAFSEGLPGEQVEVHLSFGGERHRTAAAALAAEPRVRGRAVFPLPPTMGPLLSVRGAPRATVVLVRADGAKVLLGAAKVDWRRAMAKGQAVLCVEVRGPGLVPVGALDLAVEVRGVGRRPSEAEVTAQARADEAMAAERDRRLFAHARGWWKEYIAARPAHATRLVRVVATGEDGASRPVTDFVVPLRTAPRALESPRHAARWVALLPMGRDADAPCGAAAQDVWQDVETTLSTGRGGLEDHAVLLCSALLGFGLDAFVLVGTRADSGPHVWVMTRGANGEGGVVFWESLTGARFKHALEPARKTHLYDTVDCAFNHQGLWANLSANNAVGATVFDFDDADAWKALDLVKGRTAHVWPAAPAVRMAAPASYPDAAALEAELLRLLAGLRAREHGLETCVDQDLAMLLLPALSSYEGERVTGLTVGADDFRDAIQRYVAPGHIFKGFPVQFAWPHSGPESMLHSMRKAQAFRDILGLRGQNCNFAIAARCFQYPEGTAAIWVLVAASCVPVQD